jgi:anti-sigma B factor antagonist
MRESHPVSATRGFRVHTYEAEDATIVECHGKLTYENAPLLKLEVKELIPNKKTIVIDLQEVPMVDSAGLGTLVGLYVSARTRGNKIKICNASKQVRELFSMTNLLSLFEACGQHGGRPL